MADRGAEYRAKGKVHDMRKTQAAGKEGKRDASEKQRKKGIRSRVGKHLEDASFTDVGKKVARAIGGNPEPLKTYKGRKPPKVSKGKHK